MITGVVKYQTIDHPVSRFMNDLIAYQSSDNVAYSTVRMLCDTLKKYVQCPVKWLDSSPSGPVMGFGNRYNQYMNRRGIICTKCNKSMDLVMNWLNRIR